MRDTELFRPTVTKGITKSGQRLILFDAAQRCTGDLPPDDPRRCPITERCPYQKAGKCSVETGYLKALMESLYEDIGTAMNQRLLNKISLNLFPLYQQLIRLQILAYSLHSPMYTTPQGTPKMHPVFAEIRKTIASIETTQRNMGMNDEFLNAMNKFYEDRGVKGLKSANPDWGDQATLDRFQRGVFPDGERRGVRRVRRVREDGGEDY